MKPPHWLTCPPLVDPRDFAKRAILEDFSGLRVGSLTVVGFSAEIKQSWVVQCDCGKFELRKSKSLRTCSELTRCRTCSDVSLKLPKLKTIPEPSRPVRNKPPQRTECGKMGFKSEHAAKQAMRSRLNKGANVDRLRCYHCPRCHKWHLSSLFRD